MSLLLDNFIQSPLCEGNHYYIIIVIGLTLLGATVGKLMTLEEYHSLEIFPKISLETLFHFDYFFASGLIMVDVVKIVSDWNMDGIIKLFLIASVWRLFFAPFELKRGIDENYVKKGVIKPSYPPDETIDLTHNAEDRRAVA